ncbi:hypothetical protein [Solihabitans fulvus]|uniref:hypothetical protein n=1 Tax=Solihabitans fulvus TaxID=1892852 RepID=UPI0016619008|nr:hypothetical protein [Solihabitans fulvus]
MYIDNGNTSVPAVPASPTGLAGGWQVQPEQVQQFAEAVAQVRLDFESLRKEAQDLLDPANSPKLGTSPVGNALSDKFNERLGGTQGLLEQLGTALERMDEFVDSAQRSLASYLHEDSTAAGSLRAQ